MGGKQRAWACAGYGWMLDYTVDAPMVMVAEGERPVLCLPPGLTFEESERAFAWAMTELYEQRYGWLALLRMVVGLVDVAA